MTRKAFLIAAITLGIYLIPSSASAQSDESDVNVVITNQTSRMDLHEMRMDLGSKGIDFQYEPKFNAEMQITGIKIKASNNDGQVLTYQDMDLADGEEIKIVRTTDEGGEVNFCVGLCDE